MCFFYGVVYGVDYAVSHSLFQAKQAKLEKRNRDMKNLKQDFSW